MEHRIDKSYIIVLVIGFLTVDLLRFTVLIDLRPKDIALCIVEIFLCVFKGAKLWIDLDECNAIGKL